MDFSVKPDAATDYFVAIYGPEGDLEITAGGDEDADQPAFPETMTLQRAQERGLTPTEIPSEDGRSVFHASTDVFQPPGASALYTQMVAMPIAPINRVVDDVPRHLQHPGAHHDHRERASHPLARDADVPQPRSGRGDRHDDRGR